MVMLSAWGVAVLLAGGGQPGKPGGAAGAPVLEQAGGGTPVIRYHIEARSALRNREVTGPVVASVLGVPAEPVDSFVYDGVGSTPIQASITIDLELRPDPALEKCAVRCDWQDEHGSWSYTQDAVFHPEHPSGLRISATASQTELLINDGAIQNVYLHGDTQVGLPGVPTVPAFVSLWGPARVTLNGETFVNPYDSAFLPDWEGHIMVTHGVRNADRTIRTLTGEIYNPMLHAGSGFVDHDDVELHLSFHDARFPETTSFPTIFSFFYHLIFEQVSMQIEHVHEQVPL